MTTMPVDFAPQTGEIERLKAVLENLGTNVLLADTDRTLIYMNPRSRETLDALAGELMQQTGLAVEQLVGNSIDQLHGTSAERIAALLSNPANLPHKADIRLGDRTLALEVNAVTSTAGEYIGIVVNWEDITDKKRFENNAALMEGMLENAPINVMMADRDLKFTYLNPMSRQTLRSLQQYLPVSVDKMIGESIDVFHKNPSYQRGILENPANLPRQALIQVGPETLDLLVTATRDAEGNYVGPMVTWSIVTEKLRMDAEMSRISDMVENSPINVMFADRDLNIVYLNPKSRETLKRLEAYLPCKVDDIIGKSVDIFHKDPSYQRGILADAANLPRQALIQVGPETLDLLVSAIRDKDGNYIGPMVTWDIVTEKIRLDNEMSRISDMVANAPVNIMLADRDLNITYSNPKSEETLRKLEAYLPCKGAEVVGKSVDIFHKDPSYQRGILADPSNLPRQALIQLGPETLDLLVTAIKDKDGNYIGPMVTWDIVTEKLRMDTEMSRISDMVANAPINIMLADRDFNITYINPKSEETLGKLEAYLPCRANEVVGKSVDIFHKDPSYQRGILADPTNLPRQALIQLGPETLDLLVTAIKDKEGNYIGPMVTWDIVTEKLRMDTEMSRISDMVANAPINIMLADRDLNISYINAKSEETLGKLEAYLPCRANEVVGKSVDIFHKDPSYQRAILTDPANLPRTALIQLGPETLELQVSAIRDKNGEYMGPMVTWDIVTEKIRLENEAARITNMVDTANLNIMMADRDLRLIYLNQAAKKMLEGLQQYLPMPVDRLLGQSIDIFHKDPSYQQNLLSNPANLPHHAEIQLGPEWLELNVVAIRDKAGEYVGPMVTWAVITQDRANRQRDEQARDQVTGISQELAEAAASMVQLSNMMASNAEENSAQANNVSSAAEQVSGNVSSVATAVEQMSATIKEIAKTVLQSSNVTQSAVERSKLAGQVISQLSQSSKEIGQITNVITSIAQQTNILALNATIEAARAGEAGKGFAVVANEVKELAKETSKATDEISTKIDSIQKDAVEVVTSVEEINKIMTEVDTLSTTVSSAVEEQAATTNEITRSMNETSTGVNEIVRNISGVADAAEDASRKSADAKDSAEKLGGLAQRLKDLVQLFESRN